MTSDCGPLEKSADLLMLAQSETAEITQALTELCPDWTLSEARVERFLAGGYSNRNYRIRYAEQRFVLRLPGLNTTTDFAAERVLLHHLATLFEGPAAERSASTVPEMALPQMALAETVAASVQHGWLLTRWVEQPVLAQATGVTGEQLAGYLAALHQRLQQLPRDPDSLGTLIESIIDDLSLLYVDSSTQQRLREYLELLLQAASPCEICHVDLNPWNLLFDGNNSWVTLDWETRNLAPPLFDLVALCDGYGLNHGYSIEHTNKLALQCLVGYNQHMQTSYSAVELDTLRTLFRWREYAWAASRLVQGTLRSAVQDDVLAQRRTYAERLAPEAAALGIALIHD